MYFHYRKCGEYPVFTSTYTRKRHVNKITHRIKLYRLYTCSEQVKLVQITKGINSMLRDVGNWVEVYPEEEEHVRKKLGFNLIKIYNGKK